MVRLNTDLYARLQEELEEEKLEEDSDKLKPYKKDLEYLDDHFQLVHYKLKVRSMDNRMEMEVWTSERGTVVVGLNKHCVLLACVQAQYDDGYKQTQRHQRQKV